MWNQNENYKCGFTLIIVEQTNKQTPAWLFLFFYVIRILFQIPVGGAGRLVPNQSHGSSESTLLKLEGVRRTERQQLGHLNTLTSVDKPSSPIKFNSALRKE